MATFNTNQLFVDSTTSIVDDIDNTKVAQFQCSSISTGTTRVYTFPDNDGVLLTSASSPSITQVTVPGDYATVNAAAAAGETNILVNGNVTETTDTTITNDLYILIDNGFTLNMGDFQFLGAGTIIFESPGNGTIAYAFTTSKTLNSGHQVIAYNIIVDNNSTIGSTQFSASGEGQKYFGVTFTLPNFAGTGITAGAPNTVIKDVVISGGGTTCSGGLSTSSAIVEGLNLIGTWNTTAGIYVVSLTNCLVANVMNGTVTGMRLLMGTTKLVNTGVTTFTPFHIEFGGTGSNLLTNINNAFGTIDLTGTSNNALENIRTDGTIDLTDAACSNNSISNLTYGVGAGAITIAGDNNRIVNSYINTTVTIPAGADQNTISNTVIENTLTIAGDDNTVNGCRVGLTGADTISISAGADRTIVGSTRTGSAISDAGTGSSLSNNLTY